MLCCLHGKAKNNKKKVFKVASPSAWAAALGEEGFFPECVGYSTRGRGFLPRVLQLG